MNKPTFRPIAMRCSKKQFESVKETLLEKGIEIFDISNNWSVYAYLTNNYRDIYNVVTNTSVDSIENYNRTIFEEWDKNIFLEYCGIQSLPEKWAIRTCEEVGKWLNENTDLHASARACDYSSIKNWDYFVYPSFAGRSHMFDRLPESYTEITIEQFREITKTNKPMSQKLTVPISEVLEIHKIACIAWKPIIGKYLSRVDSEQMITFTQEEVDKMFAAATSNQTPVLLRIFGEVQIDYDKIKTGSKVMLKYTGQHILGISEVDFDKPFDVVFFKSLWTIRERGEFRKGIYNSHCSFYQDGNYVVFASDEEINYIVSVIEY